MQILVSDEMYQLHGVPLGTTVYYEEFLEKMCISEDRKITENGRIKAITQKVEVQFDYRAIDQTTGETKWFSTHVAPFLNAQNEVIALFGTTQDITDRQRQGIKKFKIVSPPWRNAQSVGTPLEAATEHHLCCGFQVGSSQSIEQSGDDYLNKNLAEIQKISQHLSNTINEVRQVFSDVRRPQKSMDLANIIQSLVADVQSRLETSLIRCIVTNEGLTTITTQHGNFIRSICKGVDSKCHRGLGKSPGQASPSAQYQDF